MLDRVIADALLVAHFAYVAFLFLGVALVWQWPRVVWLHVPAVLWAVFVNVANRTCPLTPLENWFRLRAGQSGYAGSFVERYFLPLVYGPEQLPVGAYVASGLFVLVFNVAAYGLMSRARRRGPRGRRPSAA
jgi:Protein of Unknown function (DUF2784)